jgi:hypothetical protein
MKRGMIRDCNSQCQQFARETDAWPLESVCKFSRLVLNHPAALLFSARFAHRSFVRWIVLPDYNSLGEPFRLMNLKNCSLTKRIESRSLFFHGQAIQIEPETQAATGPRLAHNRH